MSSLGLPNVQGVYDHTDGVPHVVLAAGQPFTLRDAVSPIGDVFILEDGVGSDFFTIDPATMDFGGASNREFEWVASTTGKGGRLWLPDGRTITTTDSLAAINWSSTVSTNIPGGAPFGNDTAPAMAQATGECIFLDQAFLFATSLLFNQGSTLSANVGNLGPIYTMVNQPTVRSVTAGAKTTSQANAVRSQPRCGPNTAGSMNLLSCEQFFATMLVDSTGGFASTVTECEYFSAQLPTLTAGGTIGTLSCLKIENIPAAGITNLYGINSLMSAGTFIRHTGIAPSQFGGPVDFGSGATVDVRLSRVAANVLGLASGDSFRVDTTGQLQFGATVALEFGATDRLDLAAGDDFRISATGELQLGDATAAIRAATAGDVRADVARWAFNADPSSANWFLGITAPAETIAVGGDWANCLNSTGSNHTINAALATFTQWTVNAPAGTIGTGSVTDAANMLIQTAPGLGTNRYGLSVTSNPTGGTLNYCARFSGAAGVRMDAALFARGVVADEKFDEVTGQSTTSATLEDITGLTFDLTIPADAPSTAAIVARMTVETSTTGGSPATGAWAISINASDGTEIARYLSGTNDTGSLSVQARTAGLTAGSSYTVKGRHRRVSGTSTVNTDVAQLSAFAVME